MRRFIVLFFIALGLAACATSQTMLFKPGTSFQRKQSDLDQCKVASFRSIPQAMVTEVYGGYYNPGYINCYRHHGRRICYRTGGYYSPPSSYSYDANNRLRARYVESCLIKKGYAILNLPRCQNATEQMAALSQKNPSLLTCNPDPRLDY